MRKLLGGVVAVVALIVVEAISHWSVLDPMLQALKKSGASGSLLAQIELSPLFALVLGLTALTLVYQAVTEMKKERKSHPNESRGHGYQLPPIKIENTFSPTNTNQLAAPPIAPAKIVRPNPNMIFLRTKTLNVDGGLNDHVFFERQDETDIRAVVACFRNQPLDDQIVADAGCVSAHIVYRNPNNEEVGEGIARALWLGETHNTVDFDVGESKCAILLLQAGEKLIAPYKRRQETHYGTAWFTEFYEFKEQIAGIELRLIGSRNEPLIRPISLTFSIDGQGPRATVTTR
jgi:hypothetical protein